MTMRLLYFAWVRERIGVGEETVSPPPEVATVADLIDWLATRSPAHAAGLADRDRLRAAVDQNFADMDASVSGAREVAIFPAGNGRMIRVEVSEAAIDLAEALAGVEAAGMGGVATFTGLVRADDGVATLTLEHYPGMTEAALRAVAKAAAKRWSLGAVTILHRVGTMRPGERIVFVGAAAVHRGEALAACAYCIDRLKTDAPFWKREATVEGERWVEARDGDLAAAEEWRSDT